MVEPVMAFARIEEWCDSVEISIPNSRGADLMLGKRKWLGLQPEQIVDWDAWRSK